MAMFTCLSNHAAQSCTVSGWVYERNERGASAMRSEPNSQASKSYQETCIPCVHRRAGSEQTQGEAQCGMLLDGESWCNGKIGSFPRL